MRYFVIALVALSFTATSVTACGKKDAPKTEKKDDKKAADKKGDKKPAAKKDDKKPAAKAPAAKPAAKAPAAKPAAKAPAAKPAAPAAAKPAAPAAAKPAAPAAKPAAPAAKPAAAAGGAPNCDKYKKCADALAKAKPAMKASLDQGWAAMSKLAKSNPAGGNKACGQALAAMKKNPAAPAECK